MAKHLQVPGSPHALYEHGANDQRSYDVPVFSGETPHYTLKTPTAGFIGGAPVYEGAFITNDNSRFSNGYELRPWEAAPIIGQGSQPTRMFLTGKQEDTDSGPFLYEISVPALSASENINNLSVGTITQEAVVHANANSAWAVYPKILGVTTLNGAVVFGGTNWYGMDSNTVNYGIFNHAANLTAGQRGVFRVTGGRHVCQHMLVIPEEFRASFGGRDLMAAAGGGISIISTTTAGIALFALNSSDLFNATSPGQNISATRLSDHSVDYSSNGMLGNMNTSKGWNFLSYIAAIFFVPGTKTIMCVGMNWRGETRIDYKGIDSGGLEHGGHNAYGVNDYTNYYWLISIDDLIDVYNGNRSYDSIVPYEYGELPLFPFGNRFRGSGLIASGFLDSADNRAWLCINRGAGARFPGMPVACKIKLAGIGD